MNQQLLKGHSRLLVLAALNKQPMHGYALSEYLQVEMAEAFKFGVGMIYPLLQKLEQEKYILGVWEEFAGMRKRVYHLTKKGKKELAVKKKEWQSMSLMVGRMVLEIAR